MAVFPRVRTYKGVERKVWIAKWKDRGGKWRQKEFQRKKDAEHHEREMIHEVGLGIHVPDRLTKTFGQACEAWLEDNERRHRIGDRMSGYCLRSYRTSARRHVLPEIGGILLTKLTHPLLQEVIDRKASSRLNGVLHTMIVVITQVLNFARRRGWLADDRLGGMALRLPARGQERVLPPPIEDIHRILEAVERKPWRGWENAHANRQLMVLLALYAGLRRGEICGLQWENVDFEDGVIRVRHNLSVWDGLKAPKSRAGVRTVPIPPPLKEALLRHAATRPMTGYVLTVQGGEKPVAPDRIAGDEWPKVMRLAGLLNEDGSARYRFHSLRHAYVSMLLAAGYSLWHISKLVGHANTKTTEQVYGHLLPNDDTQRRAVADLARMLEETRPEEPLILPGKPPAQIRYEKLRAATYALAKEGLSATEIGRRIGIHRRTVAKWLEADSLSPASPLALESLPERADAVLTPPPPAQRRLFD